ncbi:hypothetical protein BGW80DRAFT_857027 [Lactifluus volemus]|nr:hypothetical protein BGW80DRAFT_857027 [Lactifluus volemus]
MMTPMFQLFGKMNALFTILFVFGVCRKAAGKGPNQAWRFSFCQLALLGRLTKREKKYQTRPRAGFVQFESSPFKNFGGGRFKLLPEEVPPKGHGGEGGVAVFSVE